MLVDDVPVQDGPNPYGFIPYVIFPNTPRPHEFWGVSDLADILEVNRALDRRFSILAQILELSGNPVTVLENVTGAQGVNVAPGALWELPENSKAYLLDLLAGGSVDQHLRYIEALYRIMDDLGEMPRMSFGEAGQARSGVALTVQLQPVVQKTNRKRLIWSAAVAAPRRTLPPAAPPASRPRPRPLHPRRFPPPRRLGARDSRGQRAVSSGQ